MALADTELRRGGRVVYGDRAFEQDAQNAMRGDIVRALIELITNADDAYARMDDVDGKIRVEVEHRRGAASWRVVVRDRATGMTQSEMESRIVELGGRASGFEEGQAVRGNLGRGAKDVAVFGPTTFESIKGEWYAALRLLANGEYRAPERARHVNPEDRKRLGIPRGNGTVVTVDVRGTVRCPNHGTLKKKLSSHYQVRDIMSDSKREVVLVNLNNRKEQDRLHYEVAGSDLLWSGTLTLRSYPEVQAQLEIRRLPERCDDPASDPCRPAGILVKGRRAIYENTLFSTEGNPYAAVIHGRLVCPYIDVLAQDYDDRREHGEPPTPNNPMPIIMRSRDGLVEGHPFYKELRGAAEAVLGEIVRAEEERARRQARDVANDRTRRDLERMAREAARFMEEELREAGADDLPGASGSSLASDLAIVPPDAICYVNEPKTLTVLARRQGLSADATVSVTLDPEGVVELIDGAQVPLRLHRWRPDLLAGRMRVQGLIPDVALIQCHVDGRLADAIIEVREEHAPPPDPAPIPATLEFERPTYRVGWNRTKVLVLRAPREACEDGALVNVSSNAPGIVVLTPRVPMGFDASLGYAVGSVRVEGRNLGAEGTILAVLNGLTARCRAKVTQAEEGPKVAFEFVDEENGAYRALWKQRSDPQTGEETLVLEIQARHPALRRYLGEYPNFPGQNTPWARLLLAEIIADNVCREVARRVDATRDASERPDAEGFYAEHYKRMLRLLPRFHQMMLPEVPPWAPDVGD